MKLKTEPMVLSFLSNVFHLSNNSTISLEGVFLIHINYNKKSYLQHNNLLTRYRGGNPRLLRE